MDMKVILLIVMDVQLGYPGIAKMSQLRCLRLLKVPNFSENMVAGHIWREYYSWNIISKECMSTEFGKPKPLVIRNYAIHMKEYVKDAIDWNKATLSAKSGKYEMLLFPVEPGPAGGFQAIPNLYRFGHSFEYAKENFSPLLFAMKLVKDNKFLIMLDCIGGLGHLMAKANDPVTRKEVLSVARELAYGKGYIGCL